MIKKAEENKSLLELLNSWLERMPFLKEGADIAFWDNYQKIYLNSLADAEKDNINAFNEVIGGRVLDLLRALGLPTRAGTSIPTPRVLEAMLHDKKNSDGEVRLALPAAVGRMHDAAGRWTVPVPDDLLADAVAGLA